MKDLREFIPQIEEFDWNKWNIDKNLIKHKVSAQECEEVFLNKPFFKSIPLTEGKIEQRYYAFGITDRKRKLTIVFTIRNNKIRVISARDMSREERRIYEKDLEKITKI